MENPADIPSRGLNAIELERDMTFWLEGPPWLKTQFELVDDSLAPLPEGCDQELRNKREVVLFCSAGECKSVIDVERFSTFNHLRRVMAQVMKFIRILRKAPQDEMVLSRDMELAHTATNMHLPIQALNKKGNFVSQEMRLQS